MIKPLTDTVAETIQQSRSQQEHVLFARNPVWQRKQERETAIKFLPDSEYLLTACFNKHPRLFMHLYYLAKVMQYNNLLKIKIAVLARARQMQYGPTSVAMRQLCNYQIIARTGTQFLWMINPYIVYKCSDADLPAVQEEWKEYV